MEKTLPDNQPIIFISYSDKDEKEKEALLTHLGVLQRAGLISTWDNDLILPGEDRDQAMNKAIAQTKVAVLLITANFLNSRYIMEEQIPALLSHYAQGSLTIFPVIAKDCAWKSIGWLARLEVRPKDGRPIWRGGGGSVDEDLAAIAADIIRTLNQEAAGSLSLPDLTASSRPDKAVQRNDPLLENTAPPFAKPPQDDIVKLITNYERHLQILKEQKSLLGQNSPPHILLQIEDIEEEIKNLRAKLTKTIF